MTFSGVCKIIRGLGGGGGGERGRGTTRAKPGTNCACITINTENIQSLLKDISILMRYF